MEITHSKDLYTITYIDMHFKQGRFWYIQSKYLSIIAYISS